jgi:site-specific recombinase XerD
VNPYEGAKHAFATDLKRKGIDDRVIQHILGHADSRSVERYARLEDQAIVNALRLEKVRESSNLSPLWVQTYSFLSIY